MHPVPSVEVISPIKRPRFPRTRSAPSPVVRASSGSQVVPGGKTTTTRRMSSSIAGSNTERPAPRPKGIQYRVLDWTDRAPSRVGNRRAKWRVAPLALASAPVSAFRAPPVGIEVDHARETTPDVESPLRHRTARPNDATESR